MATSAGIADVQYLCDEETEAMPAKSVHRSGNQQATMVTLLKRIGRTLPGFFAGNLQSFTSTMYSESEGMAY